MAAVQFVMSPARDFEMSWFGSRGESSLKTAISGRDGSVRDYPRSTQRPLTYVVGEPAAVSRKSKMTVTQAAHVDHFPVVAPAVDAQSIDAGAQSSLRQAIGSRVLDLIRYAVADSESLPLPLSFSGLLAFVACYPSVPMPLLTTDDIGALVATWRASKDEMLSIKFLDRKRIQFAWAHNTNTGQLDRKWGDDEWAHFVPSFPFAKTFFGGGKPCEATGCPTLTT